MVVENQQVDMEGSDEFAILTDSINTFQMEYHIADDHRYKISGDLGFDGWACFGRAFY